MLSPLFLLLFTSVASCLYGTHSTNVTFVPKPIRITVADLPPLSIKLYMSDLKYPRYLIYTPTGDILVSESEENRISCLLDTNNDGFPDQRRTFADASNGLNKPYGMAFVDGSFYVGNTNDIRRYYNKMISSVGPMLMSSNLTDPNRCLPNGTSERPDLVALTKTPDILFQAHSASLDVQFSTGKQFPDRYRNGAFAEFHGSVVKDVGTGYKIVFIPFD